MGAATSIDRSIYQDPPPDLVAKIIDDVRYGFEAACERWHWISGRELSSIAQRHRATQGQMKLPHGNSRKSKIDDLTAAVALETCFVLGSQSAAERAAGTYDAALISIAARRGIVDLPAASNSARVEATRQAKLVKRDDLLGILARAKLADREANEKAVAQVLRIALELVPDQPPFGRYRLPPVDAQLAAALKGQDRRAILACFPAFEGMAL